MSNFYNGSKLLNMLDINKQKPEIFISTSNRSAGKTTFFGKYVVENFIKNDVKFALLYRFSYELNGVANKFFDDISRLFFPNLIMTSKMKEKDTYAELTITQKDGKYPKICGYALALNKADNIKKCSHLLSDVGVILFDEFQSETDNYAPNEIQKFQSIHTSLARGNGKQVKYLPVIMISNFVSLLNPYYSALGVSARLQNNTNYLRGEGFVLEQGFNDTASKAQKESAFNRAFGDTDYNRFSSEKFYLNDDNNFIGKIPNSGKYLLTIIHNGKSFGVRVYDNKFLYVSNSFDDTCKMKIATSYKDMQEDTIMISAYSQYYTRFKDYFNRGMFRFQNLQSKEALISLISYK